MYIRDLMRPNGVRQRDGQAGFTLLELVIVVGFVIVMSGIFTLGVRQVSDSFQLRRAATVVTSELRRAQGNAVAEGVPYAVEFVLSSPYGINVYKQPTVGGPWVVVPRPVSGSQNWPSTVSILSPGSPNCTGISGSASNWCVTFQSLGYADQGNSVVQLRSRSTIVSINLNGATGRVSITP